MRGCEDARMRGCEENIRKKEEGSTKPTMMKFSKHTIGWIILAVSIALVCILYYLKRFTKEGFQTPTDFNIDYPIKEVFLVGDIGSADISTLYGPATNMTKAYTWTEALDMCTSLGADLATKEQVGVALDASGHWCAPGWVKDDKTAAYYPSNQSGCLSTDANETTVGAGSKNAVKKRANITKAFATCYGVKPAQQSKLILPFAPNYTRLAETPAIGIVSTGNGLNDIFPFTYAPELAYYALENYSAQRPKYNSQMAREYLNKNFNTINSTIRRAVEPDTMSNEDMAAWTGKELEKSCDSIATVQDNLIDRLESLRVVFQTLQNTTLAAVGAKYESMDLQAKVNYICAAMDADSSPACAKLATIDFETYYNSGNTKILGDLEEINYNLALRECEIQTTLRDVQKIMRILNCEAKGKPFNTSVLGNYLKADGTYFKCKALEPYGIEKDNPGVDDPNDPRFKVRSEIGYNYEQDLRKSLEGISPYFNNAGYAKLFDTILAQLSILIRLPSLKDYADGQTNLNTITARLRGITSAFP